MSENDETVIGTHAGIHASGVVLEEGLNTSTSQNYCTNCKRNTHCFVKINQETHEAIVHNTCKSDDCVCKCRTHFACRTCGYLHPYGQKCDRVEVEPSTNPKDDAEFQKIMGQWRTESDANKVVVQKKKEDSIQRLEDYEIQARKLAMEIKKKKEAQ